MGEPHPAAALDRWASRVTMNPITHALIGWSTASLFPGLSTRERGVVVVAALAPDLDGLGIVAELATRDSADPLLWWSAFHHTLAHNLLVAVLLTAVAWFATRSGRVAGLALLNVHLHLLGDLVGARGPDGAQWPILYLWPLGEGPNLVVSWQWELNAWPNLVLSVALLLHLFWLAWSQGVSPLQFVSARANGAFVDALRARFPGRVESTE